MKFHPEYLAVQCSDCPPRIRAPSSLRDRSSLLGVTPPASGRSSPFHDPYIQANGHRFADDLEGQNDEMLEGLSAKVKLLKNVSLLCLVIIIPSHLTFISNKKKITIGIGNEVRESTIQLSQMVRSLNPLHLMLILFPTPERRLL